MSSSITPLDDRRALRELSQRSDEQNTVFRLVLVETSVSTFINAFIPAGIIWLVGMAPPSSLLGHSGILRAVAAATALPIFLMTVILTAVLRRRRRSGLARASFNMPLNPFFAFGPMPLLLRALALTLLGLAVLAPAAVGFVYVSHFMPMTSYRFAIFNVSYGALIGMLCTPLVVLATVAEMRDYQPEYINEIQ